MTVDIASVVLFAFLVWLGWRSGALRQIVRIIGVVAVIVGVPFLSPLVRHVLFGEPGRAGADVEVAAMAISGLAIYVAVALAGWLVIKLMRLVSSTLDAMDRLAGATLGAFKAAILVYLLAALVVFMEGPIVEKDPDNDLALLDGQITGFVTEYNVLAPWQFPDLERMHLALRVGEMAEQTERHDLVRDHPDAAEFLRDERVEQLLEDEDLMQWVHDDHYPMTLADHRVRELLNDPDTAELLDAASWDELMDELTDEDV